MRRTCAVVLLATAVLAGVACNRSQEEAPPVTPEPATIPAPAQPVRVAEVTLGRAVGADKKVTEPGDTFGPNDTIYVSVNTLGTAPSASLSARWTFEDGQAVHEETQVIAPTGPATTEFHVSKPDGWPTGNYTVEILLDGTSVRTTSYRVS